MDEADQKAREFYRRWIERGEWELSDAAYLFLGLDPRSPSPIYNRASKTFEEQESWSCWTGAKSGPGLVLYDAETYARENEEGELVDESGNSIAFTDGSFDDEALKRTLRPKPHSFRESTCLQTFVESHINAGNLKLSSTSNGLKFEPLKIVQFFQRHFVNIPPDALLIELGLKKLPVKERMTKKREVSEVSEKYGPQFINQYFEKHKKEPTQAIYANELQRNLTHTRFHQS